MKHTDGRAARNGGGLRWFTVWAAVTVLLLMALLCACGNGGGTQSGGTGGSAANAGTTDSDSTGGGTQAASDAVRETAGTDLEIYGFSAGKADAFLLTTSDSAVLIDCGEQGFGRTILAYLEEKGITKLDYMIITHFDQDHVGGAARIINNFEVGAILQSNQAKDSEEYEKYVKAVRNASLEPVTVRETFAFTLDGVGYSVDPPRKSNYSSDDSNNSSLIISVYNGENSFLFTGDAQTERLKEFIAYNDETYDMLKVPHHGKEEPLFADLLASVSPSYAVITSSDDDPEADEIVELLEQSGAAVFLTRTAPILMKSNGTELEIAYET